VTGASVATVDDPVVSGAALRMMAKTYLAGADPEFPHASPLYGDLTGLPPLHIQVGTREILLGDARRMVAHRRASRVQRNRVLKLSPLAHR
jgi:monoterpene epsilon-lactone hydrolase